MFCLQPCLWQARKYLIISFTKNDTIATYNLLVEQYLQKQPSPKSEKLFGLSFRSKAFNCWRGYQAIYKVDDGNLYVVDMINCSERSSGKINKEASAEKMKAVFGDKYKSGKVFIDWFTGDVSFPLTNKVLRWDWVFYTVYEKEKVFTVKNGKIVKTENVDNYVDDPKGINRRYQTKISDILFTELEKIKIKNTDCDCSEKYLITIDLTGKVSNVRMLKDNVNEGVMKEQVAETAYCTNTLLKALRKLKFDVIKTNGKPVAEDVYMELWVESDGKVENRTR